ncbi:kremen protein 2 isoform X2 [Rhineura floridana]|uniref:kremen protein 2 isoform X2 n=1 Tax=Rhineura floridana TaxID=261503 RepID=UPI002AC807CB|nr:kremen protein 2 isoform X2 [Rhineura floridana]
MPWVVFGLLLVLLRGSRALQRAELSECFMVNGADYRGSQNRTSPGSAGRPCLYWNQTREHAYNTAKYPNGEWGLGSHNYCRNPDGDVQPWCYISENEEGIYWKYCDIPTCHMPGYVGCFLDSGTPPALSGSSGTSTKLTVQVCLSFCRKRGYKFAGVEAGYACFCGHEVDVRRSQPVSGVECDQVCFGKSSELCGGDGRIGIYNVSMGACQGNFSELSGVIYSPQFPDDYEADSNCTWALRPLGCESVELTFRIFDMHDPNDRLELRDGHNNLLLAQFDGRRRPGLSLLLPTNFLLLSFQSDQLLQAQGFAILYRGVKGPSIDGARSDLRTLPGDGPHLIPTSSDWLNSTWTYNSNESAIGVGGKERDLRLGDVYSHRDLHLSHPHHLVPSTQEDLPFCAEEDWQFPGPFLLQRSTKPLPVSWGGGMGRGLPPYPCCDLHHAWRPAPPPPAQRRWGCRG